MLAGPARVFISFSCQKETNQRKGHPKKTLHALGLRTAAVFWEAWLLTGASRPLNEWLVLSGPERVLLSFSCQKESKQRKGHPKKTLHAQGLAHGCRFLGGLASFRGE